MKHLRFFQCFAAGIFFFLLIPLSALYAEGVDFSGKWTLSESKSEMGEGRSFASTKMTITQKENTMTIERTRSARDGQERTTSETFTLDGKENVVENENRITNTIASWSDNGATLTVKSHIAMNRQGQTFEMNRTEIWTLEEGGKVLNIQSESSSARGDRSATFIYNKE